MLIIALVLIYSNFNHPSDIQIKGTFLKPAFDIADFHLMDQTEKALTKEQFQGRWTFVFFGFTNCPMICPTTMTVLNKMYSQLEKDLPKNQLPQVVMISVDPKRDTTKQLNEFVHRYNPQFIGARADKEEIASLEKQLHLPVADNLMNHSQAIILFNPKAQVQAYFSSPQEAVQLVKDYKLIVNTV